VTQTGVELLIAIAAFSCCLPSSRSSTASRTSSSGTSAHQDLVELRPIYHHTDAKVRAHVTVCVLALLLQRVLEGRLAATGRPMTAAACFETLATCRLNRYEPNELLECDHPIAQATQEETIIHPCGPSLTGLSRHQQLATGITPR
jgi:hypothetical protein